MQFVTEEDVWRLRESGEFDADWYVEYYPDVRKVGMDPARHFLWIGHALNRFPSERARIASRGQGHGEFQHTGLAPGSAEGFTGRTGASEKQLCILVHLYYPDMWAGIEHYLRNVVIDCDIHVNLVDDSWTVDTVKTIRRSYPRAHISISSNEGRDIGGFFRLLDKIDMRQYRYFITAHSKKSPHLPKEYSARWRGALFDAILGSPRIFRENISILEEDANIGIVAAAACRDKSVARNSDALFELFEFLGVDHSNRDCEYVSGTIMLLRSEVLRAVYWPLRLLKFNNGEGQGSAYHMDGQAEHAVERVIGNMTRQLGYRFFWR